MEMGLGLELALETKSWLSPPRGVEIVLGVKLNCGEHVWRSSIWQFSSKSEGYALLRPFDLPLLHWYAAIKERASSKVEAIRVMVITTLFAITVLKKRHNLIIFLELIDSSCDVIDGKFPAAIFE